jgi:amphi-Trp domain-containing protein
MRDTQRICGGQPDGVGSEGSGVPSTGFVYVGLQDRVMVPAYLEAIAESLRAGTIVLAAGEQEFSATPSELVRLRVEAGRSEESVHMTVKLSWSEEMPGGETAAALLISSEGP